MKKDPPILLVTNDVVSNDVEAQEEAERLESGVQKSVQLTSANFAQLSGREEMTENRLRTSQNRYLLHRTYASKAVSVF